MAGTVAPTGGISAVHRPLGVVRLAANVLCDAAGVASETVIGVGFGTIKGVFSNGGLATSTLLTFKDKKTGATLFTWTLGTLGTPQTIRPTHVITDNAGVAVTAALTAVDVNRDIKVSGQISLTVASGGNLGTGKIALIIDEAARDLALTV